MTDQNTSKEAATTYAPSADLAANANVTLAQYNEMYAQSMSDPDGFWGAQAERLDWVKKPTQVK
ncbi:acetyl-coenzyme A synthetase N-terminal domain-containing protein, partial [Pelagimonas varians]